MILFDCQIPTNYLLIKDNEIEKYVEEYVRVHKSHVKDSAEIHKFKEIVRKRLLDRTKLQMDSEPHEFQELNKYSGILSLSSVWDNLLMWSHYADKHQGFCIGYKEEKIRKSGLFGRGGLVKYSSVYPQIKPDPTKRNLMDEIFLKTNTKAKQWSYEKEYRLVTTSFPRALQRKIVLPVEFISEVILGINISDKSKAEILKYTISKKIPTFQAQKAAFKFKMLRKRIA